MAAFREPAERIKREKKKHTRKLSRNSKKRIRRKYIMEEIQGGKIFKEEEVVNSIKCSRDFQ